MSFFEGKRVLVTGGTGMIGRPLVERLQAEGAAVRVVSLDDPSRAPDGVEFAQLDLTDFNCCMDAAGGMDVVFQLAGIKGSPKMAAERPASFFVPTMMFSINMMEAARRQGVERYLFTSSIGVYAPAETFHEDDVWKTFPSPNDRFAGWAKRMGELQAEAYGIEYGWDKVSIVRPANSLVAAGIFDQISGMVGLCFNVIDSLRWSHQLWRGPVTRKTCPPGPKRPIIDVSQHRERRADAILAEKSRKLELVPLGALA